MDDQDRIKEACQINKSLVVLSNVITSLTKEKHRNSAALKNRFLHFRDSKLTFYLRDVLGGNSRTTIITNVLDDPQYEFETYNTLRFSATAKTVEIAPIANIVAEGSESELMSEIKFLLRKVQSLKQENKNIKLEIRTADNQRQQHWQEVVIPQDKAEQAKIVLDRLESVWKAVCTCIKDNDLMTKATIRKAETTILGIVDKIKNSKDSLKLALGLHFSPKSDKNRFLEIVEDIEQFFDEVLEIGEDESGGEAEDIGE